MSAKGGPKPTPVAERLWRRVRKGGPDECWEWTGALGPKGHGVIGRDAPSRKLIGCHRVSYEQHFGHISDGLWVLHHCDNPKCVNPGHLFLGTVADNNRDMFEKRRHRFGERAPWHRLTNADVLAIRASKETQMVLAQRYSVNGSHICRIRTRKTWRLAGEGEVS